MYLYRVSKINADRRRVYTREELEGNSWNDYSPEDIKSFPKSIVDNCIELKVKIEYYNINKICIPHTLFVYTIQQKRQLNIAAFNTLIISQTVYYFFKILFTS